MSVDTQRLRSVAAFCDESGAGEWASYLFSVADEVERLRAQVTKLQEAGTEAVEARRALKPK